MLRANPLYVLIGAVVLLFLYLIIFGGPNVEEARKKREAKKTKSLVEKIVSAAQKKDGMISSVNKEKKNPSGLNYGMDTSSDIEQTIPEPGLPGSKTPRTGTTNLTTPLRNPLLSGRRQSPGAVATESRTAPASDSEPYEADIKPAQKQQPATPADTYYPPPSQSIINKAKGKPSSSNELTPEEDSKKVANALRGVFDPGYGVRLKVSEAPEDNEEEDAPKKRRKQAKAENKPPKNQMFMSPLKVPALTW